MAFDKTKELMLIDGSTFLFRAYHGIGSRGGLATSDGQPTHAVFGMVNMLKSLLKEDQTKYVAVVMDAKGKTFRHEMYPEYKANRPPMPDDLRTQLNWLLEIIPAMGFPLVSIPGIEADDVIGTFTSLATAEGFHVTIVSSDKDLAQLVNDQVVMLDTMHRTTLNPEGVEAKYGVPPDRIIDFLALTGDTSDNIPGIPKVGPKTAAKWLAEFGNLDQLMVRSDEVKGKVGESLREHMQVLSLSRPLVTIKTDADLGLSFHDLTMNEPDIPTLQRLYRALEFKTWLADLGHVPSVSTIGEPVDKITSIEYETILSVQSLDRWIQRLQLAEVMALDTETTSLDAHRAALVGISFAVEAGKGAYLPLAHDVTGASEQLEWEIVRPRLRPILEDPHVVKTGQNIKYDLEVLGHHGIHLAGVQHDTMLMSYLLEAGNARHDLDSLASRHLDHITIKYSEVAGRGKNQLTFNQVPVDQATKYAAEDADVTLRLHQAMLPQLEQYPHLMELYRNTEIPLIHVLARMETHGIRLNASMLLEQSAEIASRLVSIERKAHMEAGETFNIASPKQIQEILFEKKGLPVTHKTSTGQPSTAEHVLQDLALNHVLPGLILEHRGLAKLKSTYTEKLPQLVNPRTGRIHTSYHQAVAATGRLSSSDPNLQNIPIRTEEGRRIREAFVAEDGFVLLAADYSQIELRIMAHLSEDPGLIKAFQHGLDVHKATAAEVFGCHPEAVTPELRRRAKAINFGLIYGMSAYGLARQLGIVQQEAREYIEIYFDRYPGVRNYMDRTRELARQQGFVETLFGRRLHLPEIQSKNAARRQYAERTAINAPMQGTAADLIKMAMVKVDQWLLDNASSSRMILQVHDELVLEVPEEDAQHMANTIAEIMCSVAELSVPLLVDTGTGPNWKVAH